MHYPTVFCPAVGNDDVYNHVFDVKMTSQSAPATPPAIYSTNGLGNYNRIYQFEFIGDVTLTITKPARSQTATPYEATMQAIFLD